jgi:hypothetical protein
MEKLADRMEGDTMISFFEHLSTRDEAATLTVRRDTPRANPEDFIFSAIFGFLVLLNEDLWRNG